MEMESEPETVEAGDVGVSEYITLLEGLSIYQKGESEGLEPLVELIMKKLEVFAADNNADIARLTDASKKKLTAKITEGRALFAQLRLLKDGTAALNNREVIEKHMQLLEITSQIKTCESPWTRWTATHSEESEVSRIRSRFLQLDSADSTLAAIKDSTQLPDVVARMIDDMAMFDGTHTVKLLVCRSPERVGEGIQGMCKERGDEWLIDELVAADEMDGDSWLFDLIEMGLIQDKGHVRDENDKKKGDEFRRVNRSDICCGDLICVQFCTQSEGWLSAMFVASGSDRLHKVGLQRVAGDDKYCTPLIIPSFVSRRFVDPLSNFAPLIHQSCFSASYFGMLNFELQLHASVFQRMMSAVTSLSSASMTRLRKKFKLATAYSTYDCDGSKKEVSGPFASAGNAQVSRTDEEKQADVYSIYLSLGYCSRYALLGFSNHPEVPELDCSQMYNSVKLDKKPFYFMPSLMQMPAKLSEDEVDELLESLGYDEDSYTGNCVREALRKGHIPLEGLTPDTVLLSGKCPLCAKTALKYTLDDAMNENSKDCEECGDCEWYVSNLCSGTAVFVDEKYSNHCSDCPGFGKCIGDVRNAHCHACNDHYFAGSSGNFPCHCGEANDGTDDCLIS